MNSYYAFALFSVTYFLLEFLYLALTLPHQKKHFARVQALPFRSLDFQIFPYGILAYAILAVSMWIFVLDHGRLLSAAPGHVKNILYRATWYALAVYGTYNLTNLTVFAGRYDPVMALQDTLWGVFVVNVSALLVFYLVRGRFNGE